MSTVIATLFRLLKSFRLEGGVAILNILALLGTFGLQVTILRLVRLPGEVDAYFAASTIPQLLWTILITTMSGALVPFLATLKSDVRPFAGRRALVLGLAVLLPITLGLALSAPAWVSWIFTGIAKTAYGRICVELSTLAILAAPALFAVAVLTAYHQASNLFIRVEGVNTAFTWLMLIAMAIALPRVGVIAAGWILLARYYLQALALSTPFWVPGRRAVDLSPVRSRFGVLLAGNCYLKSEVLVDRHLLSRATVGTLSLVSVAQAIFMPMAGILSQAIATTALPRLSSEERLAERRRIYRRNLALLGGCATILAIGAIIFVQPILSLLTARSAVATGTDLRFVMLLLAGMPIFGAMGALVAVSFYSRGDTRTPTLVSAVSFTAFVVIRVVAFERLGTYGLCAAISCYYFANFFILQSILSLRDRKA